MTGVPPRFVRGVTHVWALIGLVLVTLLCACGDIASTNPYDPSTPAAQQAAATVSGALRL